MRADLLHRRLALLTGMSGILAFASGAGAYAPMIVPCAVALIIGMFWHPSERASAWIERVGMVLALALTARAGMAIMAGGSDVVLPVVDLLFLLLAGEALRPLGHANDLRVYALSFALILAATAYHPGIFFAVGFLGFIIFGTIALSIGHLGRESERRGLRSPRVERGRIWRAAGLSGLVLASSALVFVAFPRASSGWVPRQIGREIEMAGFGRDVSLGSHGARIQPNPRVVLRVTFPEGRPVTGTRLHWRGRAYVDFDGQTWSSSGAGSTLRGADPRRLVEWSRLQRDGNSVLRQQIESAPVTDRVAFGLSTPISIIGVDGTRVTPRSEDASQYRTNSPTPAYRASSVPLRLPEDSLRAVPTPTTADAIRYLRLPAGTARIAALADSLTSGLTNDYDRAVAIETWLQSEFEYTLDLPATQAETGLDHFLFERRAGHCEYFSTAMAIMLRTLGIPTREVSGFLGGHWNELGGFMSVTENEAHAWVEVWFGEWGWVTFDPTPAARTELASGATGWHWPALAFLDALSYRWSSFVLNFSGEDQINFLSRLVWGGEEDPAEEAATASNASRTFPTARLALVAVLILLVIVGRAWRRLANLPQETRAFVQVRRAAVGAGVPGAARATPLALLELIAHYAPHASPPAREVISAYLVRRFSSTSPSTPSDRLKNALRTAKRALKEARKSQVSSPPPSPSR